MIIINLKFVLINSIIFYNSVNITTSIIVIQIFAAGSAYFRFSTTLSKICRTSSIKARAFNKFGSKFKKIIKNSLISIKKYKYYNKNKNKY